MGNGLEPVEPSATKWNFEYYVKRSEITNEFWRKKTVSSTDSCWEHLITIFNVKDILQVNLDFMGKRYFEH
ncbi:unnamed protein product [Caenorhabditis angaria]|uniref:Uncharacterized protein n=1 Tax=Caenorhabditis angaria TaxID=860376 RepID=A0A9P1II98_9PELO|nr:unnamed protein product [Caenorhabditis angaria]